MDLAEAFWQYVSLACVIWYSTVTVYVAVKGAADIRQMLARLAAGTFAVDDSEPDSKVR